MNVAKRLLTSKINRILYTVDALNGLNAVQKKNQQKNIFDILVAYWRIKQILRWWLCMFKQMLQNYAEHKLGDAIARGDAAAVQACLNRGARKVDYLLMQPADFGAGNHRVPAGKFDDPVKLAKAVGFKEGLRLLAAAGFVDREVGPTQSRQTPQ